MFRDKGPHHVHMQEPTATADVIKDFFTTPVPSKEKPGEGLPQGVYV